MIINLVLDPSTAQKFPGGLESLPKAWLDPLRQAQTILERDLTDDVTVNIQIGYGEVTEQPKGLLPGKVMTVTTGGEAGPWFGLLDNYSDLITTLRAHDPANTDDIAAYKSLSATGPAGHDQIEVSRAQAKTLGLLRADDVIDGSAGFATLENLKGQQLSVGLALHELTHALGRAAFQASGFTTNGVTPAIGIEDLFRFSKEGTYEFNNIKGAYLSYDFGKTPLARFDSGPLGDHDPGDFIGITPDDPFNRDVGLSNDLSPFDITLMGVIGYTVPLALTPPPEQVTSRHVEIDITRVLQIVTGDYSLIPWNTDNTDFYGKIFINGVEHDFGVDNPTSEADFKPGWTAEQDVPGSQTLVPIRIELWDWDGSFNFDDNEVDINPTSPGLGLTLTLDANTGQWTSTDFPGDSPKIAEGDNHDTAGGVARIEFDIDITRATIQEALSVSGGNLTIEGDQFTDHDDNIIVDLNKTTGGLEITVNGITQEYAKDQITSLIVNAGEGNNTVTLLTPFSFTFNGSGNDKLILGQDLSQKSYSPNPSGVPDQGVGAATALTGFSATSTRTIWMAAAARTRWKAVAATTCSQAVRAQIPSTAAVDSTR